MTENPSDVETYFQLEKTDDFNGTAFAPNEFPNFNGQAVEYVIITNEILAADFQEISDWKTRKGVPAVVRTVEWIYSYYPGVDQAEKVRNFIIDAYQNWGVQYVMLGGDSDIVPIRFAWFGPYWELASHIPNGEFIPADMYFACLDGNWNADGDATFGEADWDRENDGTFVHLTPPTINLDDVDRLPEVYIGRVPVEDYLVEGEPVELNQFKTKFFEYIKTSQGNENNVMLFSQDEGNVWSWRMDVVGDQFPASCSITKLYQKAPYNNTSEDVLNSMNAASGTNYHIISGFGHGGPTNFNACVGSLNRTDMDELSNPDRSMILYNNHCSTMGWEKNTVAEHYINAENGGIVYIGYTRFGFIYSPTDYCQYFIQNLYNEDNIIGNSFNFIKEKYFSNNYYDNLDRFEFFSLNISADPAMPVWTDSPDPQNPLLVSVPANVYTGEQTVQLSIDNLTSGTEAIICLFKENEIYAVETVTGTGSTVVADITCTPDTPGDLSVTITAKNYLPVETTLPVLMNPGTHLFVAEYVVDDDTEGSSNGNDNNTVDAGETVELSITLENQGQTTAANVTATIGTDPAHPSYDYITINQAQSSFGTIASEQQGSTDPVFVFSVSTDAPDNLLGKFILDITDAASNTYQDELYIEFHAAEPDLVLNSFTTQIGNDDIIDPDDHVFVSFEIFNGGTGLATGLSGTLSSSSPYVESIGEPVQTFGNIAFLASGENANPFEFDVTENYNGETIEMTLTLSDLFGKEWVFPVDFDKPAMITGLGYTSTNTDISLYWDANNEAKGYNVYRANEPEGTYEKRNSQIITGFSGYTDADLPELTTFYYKVCAVSTSGVEGALTEALESWTTLPYHPDWYPVEINPNNNIEYGSFWGAPNIYDLDNDNTNEVFFVSGRGDHGSDYGTVFGFFHDTEELYDIDENPTSISGFANTGISMTCSPAIGDIDHDGIAEVLVATRMGDPDVAAKRRLFVYKNEDADEDSKPDLMWEKQIAFKNFNGVVLDDLNNDGYMEIIVPNQKGDIIEIFDYLGNDYPGWPVTTNESPVDNKAVSMPVVADLDDDGDKEIVIGMEGGIYIWNSDGTDYLQGQNPVNTGVGGRLDCPVIVADIDNDFDYEILFMSIQGTTGYIYALENDGSLTTNWNSNNHSLELSIYSQNWSWSPFFSCGDIDMDGNIEVVFADNGLCKVWDYQGNDIISIEIPNLECQYLQPLIANIDDNNEDCEIIIPSNDGLVHAYKLNGDKVVGWPLKSGESLYSIPLIDDIDNDSKNEIIAASDNKLFIWDSEGEACKNQWGRFRLNSYNNAIFNNTCSYNPNPLVINEDKTWDTDKWLDRDLHIDEGTLTIHSTVRLTSQAKIVVKPGAELIVEGGKITNSCNENWQGIEVWGDINSHQFDLGNGCAQGKLVLNNTVIENAQEGIRLWKPNDYSTSGGIVIAENTTFKNCRRAVEFISYHNFHPDTYNEMENESRFKNCTFITNENYNQPTDFYAFVSMWDVFGIDFNGCSFKNLDNGNTAYGTGIISMDAGFAVTFHCPEAIDPCPPDIIDRSEFIGLFRGIDCSNASSAYYPIVKYSDFIDNRYGIQVNGVANPVLVFNNFENNIQIEDYTIGIVLDGGCTGFTVEENTFSSDNQLPPEEFMTFGIWVNNSGEEENLIYRNTFNNIFCANYASGTNFNSLNSSIGLKYECNTNSENDYDFYVETDGGIASIQGSQTQTAGNIFSVQIEPPYHFNNKGVWLTDYYHADIPAETPIYNHGLNLNQVNNSDYYHQCIANFGGDFPKMDETTKTATISSYDSSSIGFNGALTAYNSFKDEGDTPELVSNIEDYQPDQTEELRNRLLNDSPHLSEEALRTAADKWEVLPHNILFEILSANPDEMANNAFLDYLAIKPDPLPDYMIEMLRDTSGVETYKTILKNEMAYYSAKKHSAVNRLIVNELSDSAYASLDSLRYWLTEKNSFGSELSIVDSYIHEKNNTAASNTLVSISNNFELGEWTQEEMNYQISFKNLIIALSDSNKTIFDVDSSQKVIIDSIAGSSHYVAGAQARGLLRFVFLEDSVLVPETDTAAYKSLEIKFDNDFKENTYQLLRVTPNPASTWLSFEYRMPAGCSEASIEIVDQTGKPIKLISVRKSWGIENISLKNISSGIYICLLKGNGIVYENDKLIIIK